MAGLFSYGLRARAAGAPAGSTGHAAAALVGGGVVFALALVLPGLVYLRGTSPGLPRDAGAARALPPIDGRRMNTRRGGERKIAIAAGSALCCWPLAELGGAAFVGAQASSATKATPRLWQAQWPMLKVVEQHYGRGCSRPHRATAVRLRRRSRCATRLTLVQRVRRPPGARRCRRGRRHRTATAEDTRKALSSLLGAQSPLAVHTVVGLGARRARSSSCRPSLPGRRAASWISRACTPSSRSARSPALRAEDAAPGAARPRRAGAGLGPLNGVHLHGELRAAARSGCAPATAKAASGAAGVDHTAGAPRRRRPRWRSRGSRTAPTARCRTG